MRIQALLLAALVGCGGGQNETAEHKIYPTEYDGKSLASAPYTPIKPFNYIKDVPVQRASAQAATSEGAVLVIEDEGGVRQSSSFSVAPIRGKGYTELRVQLVARRIGDTADAAPVRPSCKSTSECEFNLSKVYTVKVSDGNAVQLRARDDSVVIVPQSIKVDMAKTIVVTLSRDEQVIGNRQITYLSEEVAPQVGVAAAYQPIRPFNYIK